MTIKIAILETIHNDGLKAMQDYAHVDRLEGLSRDELLAELGAYDAVVTKSNIIVDTDFIKSAPNLKAVGRAGVGVDNFDQDALAAHDIKLITTPTGNTISTAEFTIGLILSLIRRMPDIENAVSQNDFRRHLYEGRELSQMTVGIVGLGNTGMTVAKRLSAFGCKLIGCDRTMKRKTLFADLGGVMVEDIDEMLSDIDVLTLHVPSTPQTKFMIDRSVFSNMKPGSYLVNTARGSVVNENDLLSALESRKIEGAALDVVTPEPSYDVDPDQQVFDHPLVKHSRVIYTPHIAASTEDAQRRISMQLAMKIKAALGA